MTLTLNSYPLDHAQICRCYVSYRQHNKKDIEAEHSKKMQSPYNTRAAAKTIDCVSRSGKKANTSCHPFNTSLIESVPEFPYYLLELFYIALSRLANVSERNVLRNGDLATKPVRFTEWLSSEFSSSAGIKVFERAIHRCSLLNNAITLDDAILQEQTTLP